jgi:formylmethanofuran:tetrahydromethanopterin formyltransferase
VRADIPQFYYISADPPQGLHLHEEFSDAMEKMNQPGDGYKLVLITNTAVNFHLIGVSEAAEPGSFFNIMDEYNASLKEAAYAVSSILKAEGIPHAFHRRLCRPSARRLANNARHRHKSRR